MPSRFPLIVSVIAAAFFAAPSHAQANRIWHDFEGGKLRGTFQELQNDKVVIRASTRKSVRIPFWNLIPADQRFIVRRLREWRQTDNIPAVTDIRRQWLINEQELTGQLLKVEDSRVWIVVNGQRQQFPYEQLSQTDAKYAREWTEPLIQDTRNDQRDPFVSPPADAEPARSHSTSNEASDQMTAISEINTESDSGSADSPTEAQLIPSSWLSRKSIRLGVTVVVCLCAFAWRILRRMFRPGGLETEF